MFVDERGTVRALLRRVSEDIPDARPGADEVAVGGDRVVAVGLEPVGDAGRDHRRVLEKRGQGNMNKLESKGPNIVIEIREQNGRR